MKHTLKIKERFYELIESWEKTFEIRYNDRWFQKWDSIKFVATYDEEYEFDIKLQITNVFQEKGFWLEEWFCILSFKII